MHGYDIHEASYQYCEIYYLRVGDLGRRAGSILLHSENVLNLRITPFYIL